MSLKSLGLQKLFRGHLCPYWLVFPTVVRGIVRWVDPTPLCPVVLAAQLLQGGSLVLLHDCDALVSGGDLVLHPLSHQGVTANQREELHLSCSIQIRPVRERVTSSAIGMVLYAISYYFVQRKHSA